MHLLSVNKITSQNTWNLALIDYFADMSLLRDGDEINFQKASFTLDGCVKVYSSRIDSVDSDTRNLLIGLVDHQVVDKEAKKKRKVLETNAGGRVQDFRNVRKVGDGYRLGLASRSSFS